MVYPYKLVPAQEQGLKQIPW